MHATDMALQSCPPAALHSWRCALFGKHECCALSVTTASHHLHWTHRMTANHRSGTQPRAERTGAGPGAAASAAAGRAGCRLRRCHLMVEGSRQTAAVGPANDVRGLRPTPLPMDLPRRCTWVGIERTSIWQWRSGEQNHNRHGQARWLAGMCVEMPITCHHRGQEWAALKRRRTAARQTGSPALTDAQGEVQVNK